MTLLIKMKNFVIVLLSFVLFIGCKPDPNEESIKKIDALLVQVKEAESGLSGLSPDKYLPYMDTINFDVKFIQQEFSDTMTLAIGTKVDGYYRIVKSISKYESTYNDQLKDIKYSSKQLNNLRSDLGVGVLDSNLLAMYLPTESEAVSRLLESNTSLKIWHESIGKDFLRKRPAIDSLIATIKEK